MVRHFVSYPKSGRTWVRFMLFQLGKEKDVQFHHDQFEFNDSARPSHNFDLAERIDRYSRVDRLIYLERDPRDVMVSLYHQVTGRFRDFFAYRGSLSDFIRDEYFGAENLLRFQQMWAIIARENNFMKISYEDLHRNSEAALRKTVDYYSFDTNGDKIAVAARQAAFDSMQAIEQSNAFTEPWLQTRNGFFKVRIGKTGNYVAELSADDVQFLNAVFADQTHSILRATPNA